jgi:hypothetical protein
MSQLKNVFALFACVVTFFLIIKTTEYSKLLTSIQLDTYNYPKTLNPEIVKPILNKISTKKIQNELTHFIDELPSDRYYKSNNGEKAALYIKEYLENLIDNNDIKEDIFEVQLFDHVWKQPSIIFKIRGKGTSTNNKIIIIGCHIDSINFKFYQEAPGVDDNLSGIVTVIQAIKHLIKEIKIGINLKNSVEFHFYAAEEVGSLGSTEILRDYRTSKNIEVLAMLQQDMTGYITKSIESGEKEHFGIITDYASSNLMNFTKLIIENYCEIPYLETECGKICSDHISGLMYGYPSIYVLESKVELSNPFIHSIHDTIDKIDFNHMSEHLKLVIGFVIELAISNNEMTKQKINDFVSFRYIDFMILLMTNQTKRFIYAVIMFTFIIGIIYIIIIDYRTVFNFNDQMKDPDSEFGDDNPISLLSTNYKKIPKSEEKMKKQL